MATQKNVTKKNAAHLLPGEMSGESLFPGDTQTAFVANAEIVGAAGKSSTEETAKPLRFHFFIIDAGWKTASAKVLRDNFNLIHVFQENDPLYVLTHEQSVEFIRNNPDLIGKDPLILVHDLHAKGGRGESGYHGFRLCLGLLKDSAQALTALQKFLRFVHFHRQSQDIEKDIRERLHRKGLEGTIDVIRETAESLME